MEKICIIKAGSTFPEVAKALGDFDEWTLKASGITPEEAGIIDIQNNDPLPDLDHCRGIIITGSHAMVTDHLPWSDLLLEWIPEIINKNIPFLGICYGHQLLAEAMGGEAGYHPMGKEIGTVEVELSAEGKEDPLFSGVPGRFRAHVTHSQCALKLPPESVHLAFNSFEPFQAFRTGECAWGVQFHPEYNKHIMEAYIIQQQEELEASGRNVRRIMENIRETPEAAGIMKRFIDLL